MEFVYTILGTVAGGLLSLLGTYLAIKEAGKQQLALFNHQDNNWLKEKKLNLYSKFIGELDKIEATIQQLEDNPSCGQIDIEKEKEYLCNIKIFIEKNQGEMFLYMEPEIYDLIIKLQGKLYKTVDEKKVDSLNKVIEDALDIVKDAKNIAAKLRKEIIGPQVNEKGCRPKKKLLKFKKD